MDADGWVLVGEASYRDDAVQMAKDLLADGYSTKLRKEHKGPWVVMRSAARTKKVIG